MRYRVQLTHETRPSACLQIRPDLAAKCTSRRTAFGRDPPLKTGGTNRLTSRLTANTRLVSRTDSGQACQAGITGAEGLRPMSSADLRRQADLGAARDRPAIRRYPSLAVASSLPAVRAESARSPRRVRLQPAPSPLVVRVKYARSQRRVRS